MINQYKVCYFNGHSFFGLDVKQHLESVPENPRLTLMYEAFTASECRFDKNLRGLAPWLSGIRYW